MFNLACLALFGLSSTLRNRHDYVALFTFSAANNFAQYLYQYRDSSDQSIIFVGEENGGDIYSNVLCSGQGYTVKLPNSAITVDMPFLSQGKLNKIYPTKNLYERLVDSFAKEI